MSHRSITEAVRRLGSGARSRPRVVQLYSKVFGDLKAGSTIEAVIAGLKQDSDFEFLFTRDDAALHSGEREGHGAAFKRDTKGAAFLRDALPTALRCPTCGGLLHKNGMQTGHNKAKRDGGAGHVDNAMIQHPFCNSTYRP